MALRIHNKETVTKVNRNRLWEKIFKQEVLVRKRRFLFLVSFSWSLLTNMPGVWPVKLKQTNESWTDLFVPDFSVTARRNNLVNGGKVTFTLPLTCSQTSELCVADLRSKKWKAFRDRSLVEANGLIAWKQVNGKTYFSCSYSGGILAYLQ